MDKLFLECKHPTFIALCPGCDVQALRAEIKELEAANAELTEKINHHDKSLWAASVSAEGIIRHQEKRLEEYIQDFLSMKAKVARLEAVVEAVRETLERIQYDVHTHHNRSISIVAEEHLKTALKQCEGAGE